MQAKKTRKNVKISDLEAFLLRQIAISSSCVTDWQEHAKNAKGFGKQVALVNIATFLGQVSAYTNALEALKA